MSNSPDNEHSQDENSKLPDARQPDEPENLEEADTTEENSTVFSKPVYKENKKTGNKGVRNIVITLAALCLVVGAVFLINYLIPNEDDNTSSVASADNTIALVEISDGDIAQLNITNKNGSFTTYPTNKTASGDTEYVWYIKDVDDSIIDSNFVGATVNSATSISAIRRMGDKNADYGFENPQAVVKADCKDEKNDYTLTIGSKAPDGSGSYAKISGNDTVYLLGTETVERFTVDRTNFADVSMVKSVAKNNNNVDYFDEEGVLYRFDTITFAGSNFESPMEFISNPFGETSLIPYYMTKPVKQNVTEDTFGGVMAVISTGFTADGAYELHPTKEQVKEYNLENPEAVITFKVAGETIVLKASKVKDSEFHAVMVDDRPVIYQVSSIMLPFIDDKPIDFFSNIILLEDITSVSSLEMKTPDYTHLFELTHSKDENNLAQIAIKSGGKEINDDHFRNLYLHILKVTPLDFTTEKPTGDNVLNITLNFLDKTREPIVLSFYKYSDRRYIITTDGNPLGYVQSAAIDSIAGYGEDLIKGVEVPDPNKTR